MLKKLFSDIWHTDLKLTTEKNGYIDFSGFHGDYPANCGDDEFTFRIGKSQTNCYEWRIR